MIKIRLHSQYNHFPHLVAEGNEPAVEMYNDGYIWEAFKKEPHGECALLIEPRPLQPDTYKMLETQYNRFRYIFTHDSQLLAIAPNAVGIYYWRDYELNDEEKTKDISMICGTKDMCSLHTERMKLAEELLGEVDILGDIWGQPRVSTHDAYAPYKFSVVIENHLDDYWFTEKVLNCFSNKTIPIYFGAREIDKVFKNKGIIKAHTLWSIPEIIGELKVMGLDYEYNCRMSAIQQNYNRVQTYKDFEDFMISQYGSLLDMLTEEQRC